MEPLPRATVDAIAALARLGLSEAEREALRRELAEVLGYVGQLADLALDRDLGAAGTGVGPSATPLRPDEPAPGLSREAALANAARTTAGCFRVPPILE